MEITEDLRGIFTILATREEGAAHLLARTPAA
jgi:hypothetical protein